MNNHKYELYYLNTLCNHTQINSAEAKLFIERKDNSIINQN